MAKTKAAYQAAYRKRGAVLSMVVSPDTKAQLTRLARYYGKTQRALLEDVMAQMERRVVDRLSAPKHREYLRG